MMLSGRLILGLTCAIASSAMAQVATPLEAHLAAAREAQAHTNCHLAAQEYGAAARLLPKSGELRANEGIALYCDQQLSTAIASLRKALELDRTLTVPHLFLGLASYKQGDLATAEKELRTYTKSAPSDPTARLFLGYTLESLGHFPEAETQFGIALGSDPANVDALYARGQAALEVAHEDVVKIAAVDPSGATLLRLAAERDRAHGDAAHAAEALTQAGRQQAVGPPQDEGMLGQEEKLAQHERAEQVQAQADFDAILKIAPDSYRAHEVLGDGLLETQQQDAAITEYGKVIELNPTLPGVHETLSQCLMIGGRFEQALAALKVEMTLSPQSAPRLLTRMAQAQLALGKTADAARSLETALKAPGAPTVAFLLMAQVLLTEDRPAEALPLLKRYVAADPNSSKAYYLLSRAYRRLGDQTSMNQALADFHRTSEDAQARSLMAPVTRSALSTSYPEDASTPTLPDRSPDPAAEIPSDSPDQRANHR